MVLDGARAIDGAHAERQLLAGGLARCRFAALRFHPALRYRDGPPVIRPPAPISAVTGVQRTWLTRARARVHGCAVRFGRPADSAARFVGEGIETVLPLVTAVPWIGAAAALSAGSLGAFAPPPGLARLVVARDNDPEDERAAERLARRCARAGDAAIVIVPEGGDFNDDLLALGAPALRARLAPQRRSVGEREGRRAGQDHRERGGSPWPASST